MDKKQFNANLKYIINEFEKVISELKLNCNSVGDLKFISNHYLEQAISDLKNLASEQDSD